MFTKPHIVALKIGFIAPLLLLLSCDYARKNSRRCSGPNCVQDISPVNASVSVVLDEGATSQVSLKNIMCDPRERLLTPISWHNGYDQSRLQILQEIHSQGLTRDGAVRLALLNNPALFAYYENLELGHAGVLEAGLRENPVMTQSRRMSNEPGQVTNKEFETSINFLDHFLIPLRTNAALAEIEVIESEIREKVLDLTMEVEISWLDVSIGKEQLANEAQIVELKDIAKELSALQNEAGNINKRKARERKIHHDEALGMLKVHESKLLAAQERLNRSLGLWGKEACWDTVGGIEWNGESILPPLSELERAALANRPDIETARRKIHAIAQEANLKQWWTYSSIRVGHSTERETDGSIIDGPIVELELPVYNYGQGEQVKYSALLEQAQQNLLALAISACSEVRELVYELNTYRGLLQDFETKILPDLKQQVDDAQTHYNAMTLSVYDLFRAKESELKGKIDYLESLKTFMQIKVHLLHAVGGSVIPWEAAQ